MSILKRAALRHFVGVTTCRGGLRIALRVERDAKLFHAAAKGIRVEIQDLGRAARAVDNPIRLLENLHDVIPFHRFQGEFLGCLRGRETSGRNRRTNLLSVG